MKEKVGRAAKGLDSAFEYLGVLVLTLMVVIITWQVFSRWVLNETPSWSEEVARLLMVWMGFVGAAIGFRQRAHIAIGLVVDRFPRVIRRWLEKTVLALVLVFGLYLLSQGTQFTLESMQSTLPATGLPRAALYAVMPVTGLAICIYSVLQLLGFDTVRRLEAVEEDDEVADPTQRAAG